MTPFVPPSNFTTRPTLRGTFGMAATTHWIASATAQAVLERGGNAFDAAVAAAFVLHVVEPHLNGPGGDLVGLIATAKDPKPRVLMGQGPAPAGATIEHFAAEGLDMVPGAGALAAAIPAAVDAWLILLRDEGTWELADLLAFAVDYAEQGHPIAAGVCRTINTVADLFRGHWTDSAHTWLPGGRVPHEGDLIRNPALGRTFRRLAQAPGATREARIESARAAWSRGFVAAEIGRYAAIPHRHSSGTDHAGVITADDLAGFTASFEPSVQAEFRGFSVHKAGPWSQGPALLQTLSILGGYPDDAIDPSTGPGAHAILEALKLAMADRDAYYGDDDVPLQSLLSAEYAATRRAMIGDRASAEFRPGEVPGLTPFLPPLVIENAEAPAVGGVGEPTVGRPMDRNDSTQKPTVARPTDPITPPTEGQGGVGEPNVGRQGETRGDTCHIDVVDRWGNMISATPSGGWLQSSPMIPELGFCLGTRLQMNWLTPGFPSSLVPGKRPRTTLTPTMIVSEGLPITAFGSPGGDQQDQWQLLYLLRTLVGGYTPQQAIDAPAFHTTSIPSSFWPRTWSPGEAVVEDRLGEEVIASLEQRGHLIVRAGAWSLGRVSSVTRDPATGILTAAANPRGMQGYAVGR